MFHFWLSFINQYCCVYKYVFGFDFFFPISEYKIMEKFFHVFFAFVFTLLIEKAYIYSNFI